jgi:hypothetical protein
MRTVCFLSCLVALLPVFGRGGPLSPPILTDRVVGTSVDVNGDGDDDFRTIAERIRIPHPGTDIEEYVVVLSVENLNENLLLTDQINGYHFATMKLSRH